MMKRRVLLNLLSLLPALPLLGQARFSMAAAKVGPATVPALTVPHSYWTDLVSPQAYEVLFEEDTERSGSSALNQEKRSGTFVCAACYLPLFDSQHKFESGTGWPSFTQPIDGHVGLREDNRLFTTRTEYHCARCGGHQGHVFDDGPAPRGERWCNNGVALRFVPATEPLPALRGEA